MTGYLQCFTHALKITLFTLLLLFFLNTPFLHHSVLSLLYSPISIDVIPFTVDIFVLALLHRSSEYIYTRQQQADITYKEASTSNRAFDVMNALTSISQTLSNHYYIRTVNDGLSNLQQDSLLYLAHEIESLQLR